MNEFLSSKIYTQSTYCPRDRARDRQHAIGTHHIASSFKDGVSRRETGQTSADDDDFGVGHDAALFEWKVQLRMRMTGRAKVCSASIKYRSGRFPGNKTSFVIAGMDVKRRTNDVDPIQFTYQIG